MVKNFSHSTYKLKHFSESLFYIILYANSKILRFYHSIISEANYYEIWRKYFL